jgi:hypothetical protein
MTGLPMSEDDLLRTVLDMAQRLGVRAAHFRPAKTDKGWRTPVQGDGKGFPDVVLAGAGGLLFRELKSDRGALSPEQRAWLSTLLGADADADVWRPTDLTGGRIEAEIRALRQPRAAKEKARA